MEFESPAVSRRSALGLAGAATAAALAPTSPASASPASASPTAARSAPVQVLINDAPAAVGSYAFPDEVDRLVLDNGLIKFTFTRDDAAGGIVTGWTDVSITASSIVVDGVELAHNLNGVAPRDPDRQHSFYIDAGGGSTRLVCTQVRVLRVTPDLVEVAFADTASTRLRHEHHLILRRGRRGIYGYNILTAVVDQSISEVRMNTRWDRAILDHSFNWERGKGQQPTYAYLATQTNIGDETWRVDGVNNPDLPSPDDNAGGITPGTVYTKYNWSLYHHENPMFGHYGHGFGVWFTALGGVSDDTLCAFYGSGPNHQDLAIHQDALILNYFSPNHYGQVAYPLTAGYQRLYGPWFSYVTVGDPDEPDAMIARAAEIARAEIEENRAGSRWLAEPFYPPPAQRSTVTGRLRLADGRPAEGFRVLLSSQDVTDVFTIHEATYFVRTDAAGRFSLPGVPPAWRPGTRDPGSYVLYIFAGDGSVTGQYKQTGIAVAGPRTHLGDIVWAPERHSTFLWQLGRADRTGGEFALATDPVRRANPRSFEKTALVPADLTFTVGTDWEPQDWYYAQTNPGTWTISFTLDRAYTGTAALTVSSSIQAGNAPTVAVNGSTADITGALPANNDSTIGRQADRSGFPRLATLTFPASLLRVGANEITLARAGTGGGMGWDTLLLEVDELVAPAPAKLAARVLRVEAVPGRPRDSVWTVEVTNAGAGAANDVRLDRFGPARRFAGGRRGAVAPIVAGRDPARFPVPVAATIAPGGSAVARISVDSTALPGLVHAEMAISFTANGGLARTTVTGRRPLRRR